MKHDRVDLRWTPRGEIVAVLFGATLSGTAITAEAMMVLVPVQRPRTVFFEKQKIRVPALSPDFYWDVPTFEVK